MSASSRSPVQGHVARKRFGQNFLVDQGVIQSIVACIAPRAGERVVEIGPGLGALTGPLADALGTPLHVVELDRDLIGRLHRTFGERLVVHAGDALAFDFGALAVAAGEVTAGADAATADAAATTTDGLPASGTGVRPTPSLRIVGNLPYNISSPLLFHLMGFADKVIDQHFMLQDEVVERMVAVPGTKAYSRLSVMLQFRYEMEKLLDVPPESFNPAPKVNSAIVRMLPHRPEDLPEVPPRRFAEVVTAAFSQRRKMLRNTLGAYRETVDFDALGFDLSRRAEDVPVAEYVTVAQRLAAAV
ncbi:MAG: 16S rRNA (adenine(1518)-N(6)/adenine(1519)-N(6))-dimethyltransferase RsmA [Janthinobacterium lividum]